MCSRRMKKKWLLFLYLSVEEGTAGNPNPHSCPHHAKEVGVVGEGVEGGHAHHAQGVHVGLELGDPAVGAEVLHHPA